jgi:hypothetical protein
LWWRLVAISLTTPGHDVVLIEPGGRHWKSGAAETKANLDFNSDGRLLGVELVGAMDVLPKSLLDVLSASPPK